jgi:hypothetical protein
MNLPYWKTPSGTVQNPWLIKATALAMNTSNEVIFRDGHEPVRFGLIGALESAGKDPSAGDKKQKHIVSLVLHRQHFLRLLGIAAAVTERDSFNIPILNGAVKFTIPGELDLSFL